MSAVLLARSRMGTLATVSAEMPGYPFASLAPFAMSEEGDPVFLLSDLAEHTVNIKTDPRASLLVAEAFRQGGDPLALERVTLLGKIGPVPDQEVEDLYLQAHPEAKMFSGMKDFSFYVLAIEKARYVGGFGRMSWVERQELIDAGR